MLIVETEITFIATQQDISLNQIPKKSSTEKIDNFLKIPEKILKKNTWLINISKQKLSINKIKSKIVVISILNYSGKEELSILILKTKVLTLVTM